MLVLSNELIQVNNLRLSTNEGILNLNLWEFGIDIWI